MPKINETGVFQLNNGYWGFRYAIVVNGKRVERKRNVDEVGNPYKTKTAASKARQAMIERERNQQRPIDRIIRKTVVQVYEENIVENTTAAESRIRDTDMAKEMVRYSNINILEQVGHAIMAQANQSNQGVLSLLQ